MRNTIFLLFICLTFGCNPAQDEAFQLFYQNYQKEIQKEPLLRAFLEEQLFFDSISVIPHSEEVQRVLALSKNQLEQLHQFELERLDPSLHEHHDNLHSFLSIIIQNIETKKIHETNPDFYSILPYLKKWTQSQDIELIDKGLNQLSSHFKVAIKNLKHTNSEALEPALSESIGVFEFLSNELQTHIDSVESNQAIQKDLSTKLTVVKLEVKNFIGFCNSRLFEIGNSDTTN